MKPSFLTTCFFHYVAINFMAASACPILTTTSRIDPKILTAKTYYVSWNGAPYVKCSSYPQSGYTLARLGDPAFVCDQRTYNMSFRTIFTKSGERFRTTRLKIAFLPEKCDQSGDSFLRTNSSVVDFSIEYSNDVFSLKEIQERSGTFRKIEF